jgi:hypothetical protein
MNPDEADPEVMAEIEIDVLIEIDAEAEAEMEDLLRDPEEYARTFKRLTRTGGNKG